MQKSLVVEGLLVVAIVGAVGYGTVVIRAMTDPNVSGGNQIGFNRTDPNAPNANQQSGNFPGGGQQYPQQEGGQWSGEQYGRQGDQTSPLDDGFGGAAGNDSGNRAFGDQQFGDTGGGTEAVGGAPGAADSLSGGAGNNANAPTDGGSREAPPQAGGDNTGAREGASGQGGGAALDQGAAPAGPGATGRQDDFPVWNADQSIRGNTVDEGGGDINPTGVSPSVGLGDQGAVKNDEGGTGEPSAFDEWLNLMKTRENPQDDAGHGAAQGADGARVGTAGDNGPTDSGYDVTPDDETDVGEKDTEEQGDGQDENAEDSVGSSDDEGGGEWWGGFSEFLFGPNNNGSATEEAGIADINRDQTPDEEDKGTGIGDAIRGLFGWLSSF